MRTRALRATIACIVVALVAQACSSQGDASAGSAELVLAPITKVLDANSLDALMSVDEDFTLTFSETTDVVASLEPGDVVAAGTSEPTPGGLMRKVASISERDGTVTVSTEAAAIDEAIERGHISYEAELSLTDIDLDHPGTELADGVELVDDPGDDATAAGMLGGQGAALAAGEPIDQAQGGEGGGSRLFALNNVVVHDGADGRVTASGSFAFAPRLRIVVDIDGFELDEFTVNVGVREGVTLRLNATGSAALREDFRIATTFLTPITIPAGPLPVIITPRIDVVVTASGSIEADLSAAVVQTADASVGFGWKDGGFDAFADSSSDYQFDAPQLAGAAAGQIAVGGRLGMCLWAVFCGYVQGDGFVGLDASIGNPPPCVDWALSAGLLGKVGLDLPLIVVHVQEDVTVLEESSELDRFRCGEGGSIGGGQGSGPPWARSYSGDLGAGGWAIESTRDGGSIVAGGAMFSSSFGGGSNLWVLKLDPDGDIEWERLYFGTGAARAVRATGDGYLVAASGGEVLKLDTEGRVVWARRYTVSDDNGAPIGIATNALVATTDGGAVVTATTSNAATSDDIVVVRITENGDVDWSRRYGGTGSETAGGLALGADGDLLVAGTTTGSFGSEESGWLLRLGSDGGIVSQKRYAVDWFTTPYNPDTITLGDQEPGQFRAVAAAPDGGAIVGGRIGPFQYSPGCDNIQIGRGACGDTGSTGWVGWVMRLGRDGAVTWSTALSMGTLGDEIHSVTFAGSSVVAAGSLGLGDEQDVWAVGFGGGDGDVAWSRTFGGPRYDSTAPLILRGGSQFIDAGGSGVRIVGSSSSLSDDVEMLVLDMTLTGRLTFADGSGVTSRDRGGLTFSTVTTSGPFGDPQVATLVSDTDASPTNAGVGSDDITDGIEVAATRATTRTLAGG